MIYIKYNNINCIVLNKTDGEYCIKYFDSKIKDYITKKVNKDKLIFPKFGDYVI